MLLKTKWSPSHRKKWPPGGSLPFGCCSWGGLPQSLNAILSHLASRLSEADLSFHRHFEAITKETDQQLSNVVPLYKKRQPHKCSPLVCSTLRICIQKRPFGYVGSWGQNMFRHEMVSLYSSPFACSLDKNPFETPVYLKMVSQNKFPFRKQIPFLPNLTPNTLFGPASFWKRAYYLKTLVGLVGLVVQGASFGQD